MFCPTNECHCCQKWRKWWIEQDKEFFLTRNFPPEWNWHCEDCWNKHHNGLRDNDWLDLESFKERHGKK
jgi:hypothetical protein